MTRRDTIIIAVLLNTGLLALLFMMATNPDEGKFSEPSDLNHAALEMPLYTPVVETVSHVSNKETSSGDEVENVLKDFAATLQSETLVKQEPIAFEPTSNKQVKPAAQESMEDYVEIIVKRGDSLSKIAAANNTTVNAIKRANNLSYDTVKVGQVLYIPTKSASSGYVDHKEKNKPSQDPGADYYTIQSGDNPWKIAKKFHISVKDLLKMNNLDEAKARNLKPGDRIRVQ